MKVHTLFLWGLTFLSSGAYAQKPSDFNVYTLEFQNDSAQAPILLKVTFLPDLKATDIFDIAHTADKNKWWLTLRDQRSNSEIYSLETNTGKLQRLSQTTRRERQLLDLQQGVCLSLIQDRNPGTELWWIPKNTNQSSRRLWSGSDAIVAVWGHKEGIVEFLTYGKQRLYSRTLQLENKVTESIPLPTSNTDVIPYGPSQYLYTIHLDSGAQYVRSIEKEGQGTEFVSDLIPGMKLMALRPPQTLWAHDDRYIYSKDLSKNGTWQPLHNFSIPEGHHIILSQWNHHQQLLLVTQKNN